MARLTSSERQWDIFFYIISIRRSVTPYEIFCYLDKRWSKKTIKRDLDLLTKYGVGRFIDSYDEVRYRFNGTTRTFLYRRGEKWCPSCKKFRSINNDFGPQSTSPDLIAVQCRECKNRIRRRYIKRNRLYDRRRQKKYYMTRVKKELIKAGLVLNIPADRRH